MLLIGGLAVSSGSDLLFSLLSPALVGVWTVTFVAAVAWRCGPAVIALGVGLPVVVVAAASVDGPATLRAAASQAQLAQASADVRAGREVDEVGFYRVIEARVSDTGCVVFVTHTFIFDESGVAYCPDGRTPSLGTFRPLVGPLYAYDYVE